mmetsp:Transcript_19759/g.75755  ORF Transcript_19759/g.75755 Transcript_19759/m.75755 type:complete len:263 (+) Transcript_19759:55-843(+)
MGQAQSNPGLWYAWKQDEKYVDVQWLPSYGQVEEDEVEIKTASKAFVATAGSVRISGILGGFAREGKTRWNTRIVHRLVDPRKEHEGGPEIAGEYMEDVGDYHRIDAASSMLDFGRRVLHDDDEGVLQTLQVAHVRVKKEDRGEVWEHLFIHEGSSAGLSTAALPDDLEDGMGEAFAEDAQRIKDQFEAEQQAREKAEEAARLKAEAAAAAAAAAEAERQRKIAAKKKQEEMLAKQGFFSKNWLSIMVAVITVLIAINILLM